MYVRKYITIYRRVADQRIKIYSSIHIVLCWADCNCPQLVHDSALLMDERLTAIIVMCS